MGLRRHLTFPNPVNETSARLVAAGAVIECLVFLAFRQWWLLLPLVFGFAARVLAGPRFSPLGRLVTEVITPRLREQHVFVPGPPKRFAQGIGLVFSSAALISWSLGGHTAAVVLIVMLQGAAALEAFAGFCLGCVIFARLMRWGVVPATVCESCNNLGARLAAAST